MQKLKSERGITLVALGIVVIVLSLITLPVVINTTNVIQIDEYTKFKDDIDILRESISVAYFDKEINQIGPKYTGNTDFLSKTQDGVSVKNPNDNENYYAINIQKVNSRLPVNMSELNNGLGNRVLDGSEENYSEASDKFVTDVYIINEQSRTIYYVKGIEYKGKTYYRLSESFSKIE